MKYTIITVHYNKIHYVIKVHYNKTHYNEIYQNEFTL